MSLIKQAKAERLVKSALVLDLGDLQRQGEMIIEQAEHQARQIISQAEKKAAEIDALAGEKGFFQGQAEGFREGRVEGRQQGHCEVVEELKPQLEDLVEGWTAALGQWEADRSEMFVAARTDVLRFAIAMTEKVIGRCLDLDPTVIERQLSQALELVAGPSSIRIVISPEDRPLVEDVLEPLATGIHKCDQVELEEDPAMTRGGCRVLTQGGSVDATIQTQIQRIVRALLPTPDEPADPSPLPPETEPGPDPVDES